MHFKAVGKFWWPNLLWGQGVLKEVGALFYCEVMKGRAVVPIRVLRCGHKLELWKTVCQGKTVSESTWEIHCLVLVLQSHLQYPMGKWNGPTFFQDLPLSDSPGFLTLHYCSSGPFALGSLAPS